MPSAANAGFGRNRCAFVRSSSPRFINWSARARSDIVPIREAPHNAPKRLCNTQWNGARSMRDK
jgi:hypothetical protein